MPDTQAGPVDSLGSAQMIPAQHSKPLSVSAQMAVAALKAHAARVDDIQELAQEIAFARDYGLSWELIGWSLGITGEAARDRWNSPQASR